MMGASMYQQLCTGCDSAVEQAYIVTVSRMPYGQSAVAGRQGTPVFVAGGICESCATRVIEYLKPKHTFRGDNCVLCDAQVDILRFKVHLSIGKVGRKSGGRTTLGVGDLCDRCQLGVQEMVRMLWVR